MKIKSIVVISIVLVVAIAISLCVHFAIFRNNGEYANNLVINSRNDLTKILGFDFSTVNISNVYTNDESKCICVVLDMDYKEFIKDPITEEGLFYKEDVEQSLLTLKRVFPNTFIDSIENIKDGNGTLLTYAFNHEEYIEDVPYYIQWFSIEEPNEKCVIYAFLPEEIEAIHTDIHTEDGSVS